MLQYILFHICTRDRLHYYTKIMYINLLYEASEYALHIDTIELIDVWLEEKQYSKVDKVVLSNDCSDNSTIMSDWLLDDLYDDRRWDLSKISWDDSWGDNVEIL